MLTRELQLTKISRIKKKITNLKCNLTGAQNWAETSASLSKFAPKFRRSGDQYVVSKTQKYIDFDVCGLQDRYIGLPDGLGIESPLLI